MALRKKKNQQDDSEKLQELLKAWDIQLPEKEKKSDFPETSMHDFPKADFPEIKSETHLTAPENESLKPEIKSVPTAEKQTEPEKNTPEPEPRNLKTEPKTEIKLEKFFGEPRKKKPDAQNLLAGNSDLDRMFKKQVIQYLHGTVRRSSAGDFILAVLMILFGIRMMHGIGAVLSVFCFLGAVLYVWYILSWKLTFNGETNRFSYSSLMHEEIQFHASEIQNMRTEKNFRSFWRDTIILTVHDEKIPVVLGFVRIADQKKEYVGGYPNAGKFQEYLNFYQDLHGNFNYSRFEYANKKTDSSSKEELMQMLAKYQKQIEEHKKEKE